MRETNLDTLSIVLLGEMSPGINEEMRRVFRIALRDGRVAAGTGAHAGHVERVSASTIAALIRRNLLVHCYGSEGGVGGELSPRVVRRRAELESAGARAGGGDRYASTDVAALLSVAPLLDALSSAENVTPTPDREQAERAGEASGWSDGQVVAFARTFSAHRAEWRAYAPHVREALIDSFVMALLLGQDHGGARPTDVRVGEVRSLRRRLGDRLAQKHGMPNPIAGDTQ